MDSKAGHPWISCAIFKLPMNMQHPAASSAGRRLLVVDDHPVFRHGICQYLSQAASDVTICAEAANAKLAREQIAALQPDLLFLDVQMPGETGMELLESLERRDANGRRHKRAFTHKPQAHHTIERRADLHLGQGYALRPDTLA